MKIAKKCKVKFATTQEFETQAFIEDIISGLSTIIDELEPNQVCVMWCVCVCVCVCVCIKYYYR